MGILSQVPPTGWKSAAAMVKVNNNAYLLNMLNQDFGGFQYSYACGAVLDTV